MPGDMSDPIRTARRVVLYSHDTVGFGHLRRNLMLAARLKALDPAPEVLLIAGTCEAGAFELPEGVDLITLPAYAKAPSGRYVARRLGLATDELGELRAGIIRAAIKRIRPDLFIADNVPLGPERELEPALRWMAARPGTRRVLGLRDVLDERRTVRAQWLHQRNVEAINAFYSDVWVYGDPAIHDPLVEYGLAGAIRARVAHTGYLLRPAPAPAAQDGPPYVLCTVCGGGDGAALCEAFLAAPLPEGRRGILVTGSQLSGAARDRIEALAASRPDIALHRFLPDLMPLAAGAERVICMGGYNTVCEVIRLGLPALVVPRVRPRQEQLLRTERFAALGLVDLLHPEALRPEALGAWMAGPPRRPSPGMIDTGGLDRFATLAATALGASCSATLVA